MSRARKGENNSGPKTEPCGTPRVLKNLLVYRLNLGRAFQSEWIMFSSLMLNRHKYVTYACAVRTLPVWVFFPKQKVTKD